MAKKLIENPDRTIQNADPTKKPIAGYIHLTNDPTIGNITVIENKITNNWDIDSPGRTSIPITAEQALQLKNLIESFVNAG